MRTSSFANDNTTHTISSPTWRPPTTNISSQDYDQNKRGEMPIVGVVVPPSNREEPKKRVTFHSRVQVRRTLGRHEMTHHERVEAWYHKREYTAIAKRCRDAIKQWDLVMNRTNKGESKKDNCSIGDSCFRGLERYTTHAKRQILEKRRVALQVVAEEQVRQEQEEDWDDHSLSLLYYLACLGSRRQSRMVGQEDEKEAELVYKNDIPRGDHPAALPPTSWRRTRLSTVEEQETKREDDKDHQLHDGLVPRHVVSPTLPQSFNSARAA